MCMYVHMYVFVYMNACICVNVFSAASVIVLTIALHIM